MRPNNKDFFSRKYRGQAISFINEIYKGHPANEYVLKAYFLYLRFGFWAPKGDGDVFKVFEHCEIGHFDTEEDFWKDRLNMEENFPPEIKACIDWKKYKAYYNQKHRFPFWSTAELPAHWNKPFKGDFYYWVKY